MHLDHGDSQVPHVELAAPLADLFIVQPQHLAARLGQIGKAWHRSLSITINRHGSSLPWSGVRAAAVSNSSRAARSGTGVVNVLAGRLRRFSRKFRAARSDSGICYDLLHSSGCMSSLQATPSRVACGLKAQFLRHPVDLGDQEGIETCSGLAHFKGHAEGVRQIDGTA